MPPIAPKIRLTQPLKWHGGKRYLASWIVGKMPRHRHYVEPFAGGLAVLLERDPNDRSLWLSEKSGQDGVSEVVNDLDSELTNFWRVLQREDTFWEFRRIVDVIPLSRPEFDSAGKDAPGDIVEKAVSFFVRCRQSRAGTFKGFTSLSRSRTRRGINGGASEWLGAVEGLPAVHSRMIPVVVECMDAKDLIQREDAEGTLQYLDPPYMHETRATKGAYAYEMDEEDHGDLLDVVVGCRGSIMLSGYPSSLYSRKLSSWNRHEVAVPNHAAGGKVKRTMTECLWTNF